MGRGRSILLLLFLVPVVGVDAEEVAPEGLLVSEIVADPQSDWNGDGSVTASDEFVELHNPGAAPVSLAGWRLHVNDTTPTWWDLSGELGPGARVALVNPPGEINNNGHVALVDGAGRIASEVRFGTWTGNAAGVPDANANSPEDEALRRVDGGWSKGHATPARPPSGPHPRHAPPFDSAAGDWWDPGNRTTRLELAWTDADAAYAGARLRVASNVSDFEEETTITKTGGLWRAEWTLTTPITNFTYEFHVVQDDALVHVLPGATVNADGTPPSPPLVESSEWTRAPNATYAVGLAADHGVGRVEYAVETRTGAEGNWTRVQAWSSPPPAGHVPFSGHDFVEVRALARDGYGNVATGPARLVRRDATPPSPVEAVVAEGYRNVTLAWVTPTDVGSGVDHVDVRRTAESGNRSWTLPADASTVTDEGFRLGDTLRYEFVVVDGAGNPSNATVIEPDYEGRHPHALGLRTNKAAWGSGELRIHADFDRPMDATLHPTLVLQAGNQTRSPTGRWLANRTTYLVELDSSEGLPGGPTTLRLDAAVDARAGTLWNPLERSLIVDPDPPSLTFEAHDGWVNASGVRITADDALDAAPRVRARLANETEWREAAASLLVPVRDGDRVIAYAFDHAGRRTGDLSRTLHVDASPPHVNVVGWQRDAFVVQLVDNESGLRADAVELVGESTIGTPLSVDAHGVARIPLASAAPFKLHVQDNVGNHNVFELAPPPRPTLPSPSAPAPEPSRRSLVHEESALEAGSPATASTESSWVLPPATPTLGAVGVGGLGAAAFLWARRTRSAPAPSLAARVRALRALDVPASPVEP